MIPPGSVLGSPLSSTEGTTVHAHRFVRRSHLVPFRCSSEIRGATLTIRPEGELDLASAPVLDDELRGFLGSYQALVVDLRGLTFIDSAGVHLLLRWARDAARMHRSCRLIPGSERVQLVFAMTDVLGALGLDRDAGADVSRTA
ncbi:MAG: hypothetical protein QOG77_179 [Solirubrobacteraceae bacterium]|nr:hypothetical protein [Solirubrobacteraceae bacterium]